MKSNILRRILEKIFFVGAKEDYESQRGQALAIIIIFSGILHFLSLLLTGWCRLSACSLGFLNAPIIDLVVLAFIALVWFTNRRGNTTLAIHFVLIYFVVIIGVFAINAHQPPLFIAFSLPIIVAGYLLYPTCAFLYASLSTLVYVVCLYRIGQMEAFDYPRVGFLFLLAGVTFLLSSRFIQALREKEKSQIEFRDLFERVPVGLYRTSPEGQLLEANLALAQMLGYPDTESLIKVNVKDLYTNPENHISWVGNFPKEKGKTTVKEQFRRLDGSSFWGSDSTRAVFDSGGAIVYYEGSLIDITERKLAEDTLKRSEAEKTLILNATAEMFSYYDLDLRILWANKAAADSVNLPLEKLIGKHCYEIWHIRDEPCAQCPVELARDTGEPQQAEMTTPDGRIWFIRGYPIKDESGRLIALTEFGQNITERRHFEMVQQVIYKIAEVAQTTQTLDGLYAFIHQSIGTLLPADNFYIALYDQKQDLLSFPYFVDQVDVVSPPSKPGKGLTEYVLRTKKSQFINQDVFKELFAAGEVELVGVDSISWIGVPLILDDQVFGVLVVQTYDESVLLSVKDMRLLEFVSGQVAMAIHRKFSEAELLESRRSLNTLLSNMPGMAYRCKNDSDWTMILVSDGCFDLTGYTPQELVENQTIAYGQITHPDDRGRVWDEIQKAVEKQTSFQLEYRIITASQQEKWVWEQGRCMQSLVNDQTILEGFITDITERKFTEEALRRRAAQLALLNDIVRRISASHNVTDILTTTVNLIQENFGYHHVSIFTTDSANGILILRASAGKFIHLFSKDSQIKLGMGMIGWCGQQGKTLLANDVAADEHYINIYPDKIPTRSELSVPVQFENKVYGVLDIQSPNLDAFDQNDIQVMETLADQIALGLENTNLLSEIRQQIRYLNILHTIDQIIASSTNRQMVLSAILEQAIRELGADAGDFRLYSPFEHSLDLIIGSGFKASLKPKPSLRLGEDMAGQAIFQRKTISVHNSTSVILPGEEFTCYYGVPLVAKGEIKGILELYFRKHIYHNIDQENFLTTLAGQAAIALDNLELFDRLQRTNIELSLAYNETIEGLSAAIDLRDKETEGHTQRVTDLTLRLAVQMDMPETQLLDLRRGALLHNIGKLGVPDYILQKRGRLTKEEMEKIRSHPAYAFELLSKIAYLRPALDIPYCHREKWNGAGYPRGLKGEQIPISARIFSVVNIWDTLTNDRPYHKAWSQTKALAYIRKQSGIDFDPQVVNAFIRMLEE